MTSLNEEISTVMTATIPMGRWGGADDMTGAASFLAVDASADVTCQAIVAEGGLTAG